MILRSLAQAALDRLSGIWSEPSLGPVVEPVTPPQEVLDAVSGANAWQAEPMTPSFTVASQVLRPPVPASGLTLSEEEEAVLDEVMGKLAEKIAAGASPWDAAWSVFGGAGASGVNGSGRTAEASLAASTRVAGVPGSSEAQKRTEGREIKIDQNS